MAGGRPRTTSLPENEMIELGKEMVAWVKENRPYHLSTWYTLEKGFIYEEWKTFIQRKEFIPFYQAALLIVGEQYLIRDTEIEPSLKQRWQKVYFKDYKEAEEQEEAHKSSLRKEENKISAQTLAEIMKNPLDISQK